MVSSGRKLRASTNASRPVATPFTSCSPSVAEQPGQPVADDGVVVDDQDLHAASSRAAMPTGSTASTRHRPPSAGPAESAPPPAATRSAIPVSP